MVPVYHRFCDSVAAPLRCAVVTNCIFIVLCKYAPSKPFFNPLKPSTASAFLFEFSPLIVKNNFYDKTTVNHEECYKISLQFTHKNSSCRDALQFIPFCVQSGFYLLVNFRQGLRPLRYRSVRRSKCSLIDIVVCVCLVEPVWERMIALTNSKASRVKGYGGSRQPFLTKELFCIFQHIGTVRSHKTLTPFHFSCDFIGA